MGRLTISRHAALLVLLTSLSGCDRHSAPLGATAPESGAVSAPTVHRLPAIFVDEAGTIEHVFDVTNPTDRTIRILEVKRSCACANATIASQELKPGQQTQLVMKVDLRGRTGVFGTECVVRHDAGEPWRFRLETMILRRIEFAPEAVRLGTVDPAEDKDIDLAVMTHSRDAQPPDPSLSVVSEMQGVTLEKLASTVEQLPDGISRRRTPVRVRFTTPRVSGTGCIEVVSVWLSVPAIAPQQLRIEWFVDASYDINPKRAFFHKVPEDAGPVTLTVVIRQHDGTPFRVLAVESNREAVTAACSTQDILALHHEVLLTLEPDGFAKFLYGEAIVTTDDSAIPRLRIPVAASR